MRRVVHPHPHVGLGVDVPLARPVDEALIEQHRDAVPATKHAHAAHGAVLDELLHADVRRVVAHLERQREEHAVSVHGVDDPVTVSQAERHGLLQDDILARLAGCDGEVCVLIGLAGDEDDLNGRVVEHILEVRPEGGAEATGSPLAPCDVVVPDAEQLRVIEVDDLARVRAHVSVCIAEYADAYLTHSNPSGKQTKYEP